MKKYDVVIVGLGPTGGTLANLLALNGFSILILEREKNLYSLPFTVVDFINDLQLSPLGIILVICAIYLVLGTVMDSLAMLFLTIPVFYPVIADAGIDPIWFGIFAVIVVEFGLISPPVGMNLFVIKGVMQRTPLQTIGLELFRF